MASPTTAPAHGGGGVGSATKVDKLRCARITLEPEDERDGVTRQSGIGEAEYLEVGLRMMRDDRPCTRTHTSTTTTR